MPPFPRNATLASILADAALRDRLTHPTSAWTRSHLAILRLKTRTRAAVPKMSTAGRTLAKAFAPVLQNSALDEPASLSDDAIEDVLRAMQPCAVEWAPFFLTLAAVIARPYVPPAPARERPPRRRAAPAAGFGAVGHPQDEDYDEDEPQAEGQHDEESAHNTDEEWTEHVGDLSLDSVISNFSLTDRTLLRERSKLESLTVQLLHDLARPITTAFARSGKSQWRLKFLMCPHALTARIANDSLAFESINDGGLYLHVLNRGNYTVFSPNIPLCIVECKRFAEDDATAQMAGEMLAAVLDRVNQLAGGKPDALSDGQRTIHLINAQQSRMRYLRATFSVEYLSQLQDGTLDQTFPESKIDVSTEMELEVVQDRLAAAKLLLAVLAEVDQVWPDFLLQSGVASPLKFRKMAMTRVELVPDFVLPSVLSFHSISARLGTRPKNRAARSRSVGARATLRNHSDPETYHPNKGTGWWARVLTVALNSLSLSTHVVAARNNLYRSHKHFAKWKRRQLPVLQLPEELEAGGPDDGDRSDRDEDDDDARGVGGSGFAHRRFGISADDDHDARGFGAAFRPAERVVIPFELATTWDPAKQCSWEEREGWGPVHIEEKLLFPDFAALIETECVVRTLKPVGLILIAQPDCLDLIVRLDMVVSEITPHLTGRLNGRRRCAKAAVCAGLEEILTISASTAAAVIRSRNDLGPSKRMEQGGGAGGMTPARHWPDCLDFVVIFRSSQPDFLALKLETECVVRILHRHAPFEVTEKTPTASGSMKTWQRQAPPPPVELEGEQAWFVYQILMDGGLSSSAWSSGLATKEPAELGNGLDAIDRFHEAHPDTSRPLPEDA
ncbi:hypothetical protein FN846DRAFT_912829 [Sphaerosporella brunnea]|uniref:Uncharacterized protein n=1 Tax=Sphaerosporella brunnea TaxID=1250544 RepID=A0A5J5EGK6_9PEZI|nr:hypothetical protein FN846DRAFT_912829 [Sphaerosporella brunnea]